MQHQRTDNDGLWMQIVANEHDYYLADSKYSSHWPIGSKGISSEFI